MEKEWYVFYKDYHKGPFSKNDIILNIENGDIDAESLVWKHGLKDWIKAVDGLKNDDWECLNLTNREEEIVEETIPPAIPLNISKVEPPQLPIQETECYQNDNVVNLRARPFIFFFIYVALIYCIVMIVRHYEVPRDIIIFSNKDQLRFKKLISSTTNKANFEIYLSKDGNYYLASNLSANLNLFVHLKSIDKKILSKEPVSSWAFLTMKNHLAKMKRMILQKGEKIVPGYYTAMINVQNDSLKNKVFQLLKPLKISLIDKHLNLNNIFIKKTILISAKSSENIEKILKKYNFTVRAEKGRIVALKTLRSLSKKLLLKYEAALSKLKWGKDIITFEKKYSSSIGLMIGNLVLGSETSNSSQKILETLGKRLGLIASEMSSHTRRLKKPSKSKKLKLKEYFNDRIDKIINKIEELLNK
jgi:hypothetical protein